MIKNKLLKYSNKPIEIRDGLFIHHILVSEIIEKSEEWFSNLLLPFKLSKEFLNFNIVSEEQMNKIIEEYENFNNLEKTLTDEVLDSISMEQVKMLYDMRTQYKIARYSNISEDEFENMSLLQGFFRSYILEKYVGGNDRILDKVVESLKYLLRVDNIEIDEDNMVLVVKGSGYLNDENCADNIIDGELFDEICEWILEITFETKSKIKPIPKFETEELRLEYEELMREREKIDSIKNEHEKFSRFNYIYSYVVHSDGGEYEKVLNYTYYQLVDRYTILMDKESYEQNLKLVGVVENSKDLNLKHWIESLRERNND